MAKSYTHAPLEQTGQIRILVLEAACDEEEPFRGRLEVHSLRDSESVADYTALSYTWGDPSPEQTIIHLDGGHVVVWENLSKALRALRKKDSSTRLWIDAICIDQSSKAEKAQQIPLMGKIYGLARHTVLWLGDASNDSDVAMTLMQACHEQWDETRQPLTADWLLENVSSAQWDALSLLLRRPWWSRVWVIQEALLSKQPLIQCGAKRVSLHAFVILQTARLAHGRQVPGLRSNPSYPFSLLLSSWDRNVRDAEDKCPLYEWIPLIHRFQSTVARDRFYALRSLSSEEDAAALEINYDRVALPDELLCVLAAKHFLLQYKTLLPLQYGWRKRILLPSWCPDWHCDTDGYASLVFGNMAADGTPVKQYNACGPAHTHDYFGFKHPETPHVDGAVDYVLSQRLCVRGWVVSTVSFADAFLEFDLEEEQQTEEGKLAGRLARREALRRQSSEWRGVVEARIAQDRPNPYGSPAGLRSAFWRAMIGDRVQHWKGPPEERFVQRFDLFRKSGEVSEITMPFIIPAVERLARRAFIITASGHVGLGPKATQKGDLVCVLQGGRVPFVLRRDEMLGGANVAVSPGLADDRARELMRIAGRRQTWLGEGYLHGIMDGEWVEDLQSSGRKEKDMLAFEVK